MTSHKTYRQIKNERRGKGAPPVPKPRKIYPPLKRKRIGVKGDWEKARALLGKDKRPKDPVDFCVCSHSKYHHTLYGAGSTMPFWGECINEDVCLCRQYVEGNWKGGDLE